MIHDNADRLKSWKVLSKKPQHNNASGWKLTSHYLSSASQRCLISRQTQRLCFIVVCFLNLWQAWSSGTGKQPFTINFWCPSRKWLSQVKREPSQMRILLMWAWSGPSLEGSFIHFLDSWGSNSIRADMIFASFLYQKHDNVLTENVDEHHGKECLYILICQKYCISNYVIII